MRSRLLEILLIGGTVALLAFILAVEFWPGNGPPPEEVVEQYLQAVRDGAEMEALAWWQTDGPTGSNTTELGSIPTLGPASSPTMSPEARASLDALDVTIRLADTLVLYQVEPASYWTSCCEPYELADGTDAFSARVDVRLTVHEAGCGLDLADMDPSELQQAEVTFYLTDSAHDAMTYTWGLPWERWLARPRGRQVWRIRDIQVSSFPDGWSLE